MEANRYCESLRSLRDAGYIAIGGDPLAEIVKLTGRGVEVSLLARPYLRLFCQKLGGMGTQTDACASRLVALQG